MVLADDPDRVGRTHFDRFAVDGVDTEAALIEELSDAVVAAVSTWGDPETARHRHGLPAANVYEDGGADALLDAVRDALASPAKPPAEPSEGEQ